MVLIPAYTKNLLIFQSDDKELSLGVDATSLNSLSLSIYIQMGSSYIWCNSTRVTHFVNYCLLLNLKVKKHSQQYHYYSLRISDSCKLFLLKKKYHNINSFFFFFRPYHPLLPLVFLFAIYFQASIISLRFLSDYRNYNLLSCLLVAKLSYGLGCTLQTPSDN